MKIGHLFGVLLIIAIGFFTVHYISNMDVTETPSKPTPSRPSIEQAVDVDFNKHNIKF